MTIIKIAGDKINFGASCTISLKIKLNLFLLILPILDLYQI